MVEPDKLPDEAEDPQRRRGCSCLGITLFLFAGVLALAVTAMLLTEQYVRQKAYAGKSTAEIAQFEKWLHEPVQFPAEWYEERSPVPKDVQEQRARLFQDADILRTKLAEAFSPQTTTTTASGKRQITAASPPSVYERLVNAESLSDKEHADVARWLKAIEPLAEKAKVLTRQKDYRLNDRGLFNNHVQFWVAGSSELLSLYVLGLTENGEIDKALEILEATAELNRRDPGFLIHYKLAESYLRTTQGITRHTTNTAELRKLLQIVVRSRLLLLQESEYLFYPLSGFHKIGRAMAEDGFLRDDPDSRLDYLNVWLLHPDYAKWLKQQPPSNPRSAAASYATATDDFSYMLPFYEPLRPFSVGLLKPFVHHLNVSFATPGLVAMYHDEKQFKERARTAQTYYDLFSLHLARHIAMLEGKPPLKAPEDFVPEYLPSFPADPFISAPMQFDASKNCFYSVGPDGKARTVDDVFDRSGSYEQVDRVTGMRR